MRQVPELRQLEGDMVCGVFRARVLWAARCRDRGRGESFGGSYLPMVTDPVG
jgi:hypothetical protein